MLTKSGDSWRNRWIKVSSLCLLTVLLAVLDQNNGANAQQHRTLHFRVPPLQQRSRQHRPRPHPAQFQEPPSGGAQVDGNRPTGTFERRHDQANHAVPDGGQRFQNGGHPFQGSNSEHQHVEQPTMEHFSRRQPASGQRLQNRQQRGLLSASHTRQLLAALKPGAPRPSDPQLNAMIQQGLAMHGLPKNTPLSQLVPLVMKEIKSGRLSPAMIQSAMSSMLPSKQPPPNNNFNRPQHDHRRQQQNHNQLQRPNQMHHPNQLQHSNQHNRVQHQNGNEFDRQMQERHQRELQQQQLEQERRLREERERNERQRFEHDQQQRQWHEQRQQEERRHHEQQRLQHSQQQHSQQPHNQQPHNQQSHNQQQHPQQPFINNQQPPQQPFRNNQPNQEFDNQRLPPPQSSPPINHIDQQQQQQHPVPDRVPPPHNQQMSHPHHPSPEHVASEAVIRAQTSNRIPISLPEVSNAIAPLLMNHHHPMHPPPGHHEMMMDHPRQHNHPHGPHQENFMGDRPMPIPPQPFPNINFDLFKSLPSEPAMDDGPWTPLTRAPDRDWKPSDVRWYMAGDKAAMSSTASVIASTIGPQLPSLESGEEANSRSKGAPGNPDEKDGSGEQRGVTPAIPTGEFLDDQMDVLNAEELRNIQEIRLPKVTESSNSEEVNFSETSTTTPHPSTVDLDNINNLGMWQDKEASTPTTTTTTTTISSDIPDPLSAFAATAEPPSSTEIHDYHLTPSDSFESNVDRVRQAEPPMPDVTMSPSVVTANSAAAPETVSDDVLQSNASWSHKTEIPDQPTASTWYRHVSSTVHRQPTDMAHLHSPDMDKEMHPWSPDHNGAGPLLYDHRHQKAEMTAGGFTTAVSVPLTPDMAAGGSAATSVDMLSELFPGGAPMQLPGQQAPANPASPAGESSSGFPAFSIEDLASFSRHPLLEEHLPMLRKHNLSHMNVDQLLEHWQTKFDMSYPDVGNVLSEKPPNQDGDGDENKMAASTTSTTTEHQPTSFRHFTSSERSARSSPSVMTTHNFPAYNIHAPVANHQFLQEGVTGNKSEHNPRQQDATTLLTIGYQAALDLRPSDWSRRRHSQQGNGPRGQRQIAGGPATSQPEPAGVHPQISEKRFPTTPAPTMMETTPRYGSYVKASTSGTITLPTPSPDPSPSPSPSNRPWLRRRNYNYGSAKKDLSHRRVQGVADQEAAASSIDVTGSSHSAKDGASIGGHEPLYRKQFNPEDTFVGTIDATVILGQQERPSRRESSSEQGGSPLTSLLATGDASVNLVKSKGINITVSDGGRGQMADTAARRGDSRDGSATADALAISVSGEDVKVGDIRSAQLSEPKRKLARFLVRRRKVLKSATASPASSPEMAYSNPLNA